MMEADIKLPDLLQRLKPRTDRIFTRLPRPEFTFLREEVDGVVYLVTRESNGSIVPLGATRIEECTAEWMLSWYYMFTRDPSPAFQLWFPGKRFVPYTVTYMPPGETLFRG
jgi:hypothetical protein